MDIINKKINWFPGHMKKATDEILKNLKNVDFFIQLVDARCPITSSNNELIKQIASKPIINLANKADLSDWNTNFNNDFLLISTKKVNDKNLVIKHLYQLFEQKIKTYQKKGLVNPKFIGMIIGLPNIGKSSLINFLAPKKTLKVENRPGVTKTQSIRQINQHFYLIDTPGIFLKDIQKERDGFVLTLINCIKKEVLELEAIIRFAYEFYLKNYQKDLFIRYKINQVMNFEDFIDYICQLYNYKLVNNEFDYSRAYENLFNDFCNGLICKVNYDQ
ncbi:ribosome biogenesis GTPase YlqF [Ureaplasma urealyticum]|uniref:Ribosome biogenesis GTPase A n=5 Tax=Ureaplasma urealyticum TaxID=2130 RepID=A0AAP9D7M6_UREUR|nr:ribosome biogenesis GTPase YlqF [Ureaplasma urealyticum]EDX54104.1 ribosome biogenesis GTP-binding protein YlqF [Ureaplasma urealyticum serovar 9 str. ATCC 33175]ACI60359.1 ribosome biogenesis GTP-binding protein YlqF [Ureaplasma urealyticum serovar 10 str. ATCC 33699]EDT49712.1 ATP/GTP-binding protein [Ureaplasma urealyticum serovar 13 str. ATCC 33698]EDU06407.1 ATP/GTP-binding protein [Ureaplasma urealyticum serovar 5 str. ATCC 27817]EDU56724.1 ATP/GTP-binding protein [Ureaplasma urealyti